MNALKISSALIAFKQSTLSSASLDALVSGVIAGLDPVDDIIIINQWKEWGALAYNAKEYKQGWKSCHNKGRFPPQMVSKNAKGQATSALEAEVERICGNTSALWGRQDVHATFLQQQSRRNSAQELNAARMLNNQRSSAKLTLREIPDISGDLMEVGFE
jgi:hypothetical protein